MMDSVQTHPERHDSQRVRRTVLSIACALFAIPLVAMLLTNEVN